jgi:hypothetical protein
MIEKNSFFLKTNKTVSMRIQNKRYRSPFCFSSNKERQNSFSLIKSLSSLSQKKNSISFDTLLMETRKLAAWQGVFSHIKDVPYGLTTSQREWATQATVEKNLNQPCKKKKKLFVLNILIVLTRTIFKLKQME